VTDAAADSDERLRLAVYGSLARSGRVPSLGSLASTVGGSSDEVSAGLQRLHEQRHLVVRPDARPSDWDGGTHVVLAHPFATRSFAFAVMGAATVWWGGCAWDSFAIPHLVRDEPEVLVSTRCPACGRALAWVVGTEEPPAGPAVAHFVVPVARIWDDVVHACANQRLYCDEACVEAWLARTGAARGAVLDLTTLWRLASHWYDGRLEAGYRRRDPATAAAYFRDVGLVGPFWGG
jgi:hypothetical protein